MPEPIILLESTKALRQAVTDSLAQEGFSAVRAFATQLEMMVALDPTLPDPIINPPAYILAGHVPEAPGMPKESTLELLKELRQIVGYQGVIIVLTFDDALRSQMLAVGATAAIDKNADTILRLPTTLKQLGVNP